ncbi:1-(5-phosphoribosyl)-5-[(5-phosphoribosylamino)methylideneamino]imidazole-4-carboxamide isomerase [Enterococcus sp. CWB-B31]|uniref:1-(5-phosphoribosyl)-5-[(5- phosphoribosylamino)methylideneamino]imidazole-4- carboxamide isomerase n=1 Tax=Enterococcus sp. CWB-B31 TaxID=2885159 RepID=UPI001E2EF5B3|nr:1-(5-phosphoribosyl)-5-[(5-phosphoribosylamino)methylideneamino]imidazole-4-carboxamide isomerase [Enterococcus sp. CWB-B31]MCB5956145.1 1-(5-phosphoribosyl)-5-[(5-phosphoribosylamino)methylideneamino]imidazole-4-carboxamide isomerase [Enterococcus sp. CWB-B31]
MYVLPAIDIREGEAVRLVKGDFARKTVVNEDPLAQAREFNQSGLQNLHIVDLDGALAGETTNAPLIRQIKSETGLTIEVGGGIRSMEQIKEYIDSGVDRVIIGSAALKNPKLVKEAVKKYQEKIAVGIDAKNGKVAVSGWLEVSETDYLTMAKEMAEIGVQTIIYTDISKDGTLTGPSFEQYQQLQETVPTVNIIASGGVSSKEDLVKLSEIGVYGAIVGKAFYEGKVTLEEMQEVEALC